MDAEQLKDDVRTGRITPDRLVELVVTMQGELQAAKQELDQARRRIEELERQLGASPTAKVSEPFSVRAEEQRQEARGKKRRKSQANALLNQLARQWQEEFDPGRICCERRSS